MEVEIVAVDTVGVVVAVDTVVDGGTSARDAVVDVGAAVGDAVVDVDAAVGDALVGIEWEGCDDGGGIQIKIQNIKIINPKTSEK